MDRCSHGGYSAVSSRPVRCTGAPSASIVVPSAAQRAARARRMLGPLLAAVLLCWFPSSASANGGGPLLLIVNGEAFLYGSILIVLIEWGVYCWRARVPTKDALVDALVVNILSTAVIGLGLPLVVAVIGGLGSFLPGAAGQVFSAAGTWVYEGIAYPILTFGFTCFWLVVTFLLTVRYEAALLGKRWKARSLNCPVSPATLSRCCNAITYGGLLLYFILMFAPMFF